MSPSVDRAVSRGGYRALVRRIRGTVDTHLPADARVLTVGKGDRELAKLGTRTTGHFPQDEAGEYAGHYPADTSVVIAHLEALILTGYDHIVFPRTAYWWFDHYAGLEEHLNRRGSRVRHPGDHCRVWSLLGGGGAAASRRAQATSIGAPEPTAPAPPTDPHLNARLGRLLDALLVPGVPVGHLRRPAEPELRLLNHPVVSVDLAGDDELDPGPAIEECERQGAAVILVLSADDRLPGARASQAGGAGNPMRRALEQGLPRIAHRAHLCSLYDLKRAGPAPAGHPPVED